MATLKALCANRLLDGRVVYLTSNGGWDTDLTHALYTQTAEDETAAVAQGKAAVQSNLVIDPLLIDVAPEAKTAVSIREKIRAAGPTVRRDLNRAPGQPAP